MIPLRHAWRTIAGLYELLRLSVMTRFRFNGRYWRWRMDTAFGSDPAKWPPRAARRRAAIEYGTWVRRMKRLRDS